MVARNVRKNINVFVDGQGFAGQVEEVNTPKLVLKMEEFRAGGMDMPVEIEMGMEKLETDFSLVDYNRNVLAKFGIAVGQTVPFVAREMLESHDGTITAVVHTMRGKIKELDPGTSKPGEKASLKVVMALQYYKLVHGGVTVHEIDVVNMIRVVNGADVLAQKRAALGI